MPLDAFGMEVGWFRTTLLLTVCDVGLGTVSPDGLKKKRGAPERKGAPFTSFQ